MPRKFDATAGSALLLKFRQHRFTIPFEAREKGDLCVQSVHFHLEHSFQMDHPQVQQNLQSLHILMQAHGLAPEPDTET